MNESTPPPSAARGEASTERPPHDALRDLHLLIRSRYGLIHLETLERERAGSLLRHLADRLDLPLFVWSRLDGLTRAGREDGIYDTGDADRALDHVRAADRPALYHFHGLATDLRDRPETVDRLREAARTMEPVDGAIVLTGEPPGLPADVALHLATVALPGPGSDELRRLLSRIVRDMRRRGHVEVDLSRDEAAQLLNHLSGLTLLEAEKVLTRAIVEDGRLGARDIEHVIAAKKEIVERDGLLEYYPVETALDDIADLARLKEWLARRRAVVQAPERAEEFGLDFPKGLLLVGVPGCGKSLSAKAVAGEWSLPLLKLDPSGLYNKYIGESEQNFRRAVRTAERIAPVVLWIDELEKAFASGGSEDGGVSQRILGSFLSWMQERRGEVFVVATANDVDRLPPEFLRKGRFDEIFFVDLPDENTRREIFRIHLQSRNQDPDGLDLDHLAERTRGFNGAEIEEVVVSALYTAFASGDGLGPGILRDEVERTRPLSLTRAEDVDRIRAWGRERAVRAN